MKKYQSYINENNIKDGFYYINHNDINGLRKWLENDGDVNIKKIGNNIIDNLLFYLLYAEQDRTIENYIPYIKLLIEFGIDINFVDNQDNALSLALLHADDDYKSFYYIIDNTDININQIYNDNNNTNILVKLLKSVSFVILKPLNELIKNDVDVNIQFDDRKWTPLTYIANRFSNFFSSKNENFIDLIDALIDADADWTIKTRSGYVFLDFLKSKEYNYFINKYPEKYKDYLKKKEIKKFKI